MSTIKIFGSASKLDSPLTRRRCPCLAFLLKKIFVYAPIKC